MSAVPALATKTINFRIQPAKQDLIDRAANMIGQNRTDFIVQTVVAKASEILADRQNFALNADQMARFNAVLDEPARSREAVARLMATKAPWER